jgi:sporulation protein YlmC with PRC-barrel domain
LPPSSLPPRRFGPAGAVQDASGLVTTVPNDALTVSTYYNEDVYDQKDNKIGDVNDILLDKDGRVSAVIVGVGGFLGIGEKDVAVSFDALKNQGERRKPLSGDEHHQRGA